MSRSRSVLAIRASGRNPRYLTNVELGGIDATTIDDAPIDRAELVVLAIPSLAFSDVAAALPGDAPVLSLTKGLDPATGNRGTTRRRA
jgi:glycerol-3-phosphate dehydrogenase